MHRAMRQTWLAIARREMHEWLAGLERERRVSDLSNAASGREEGA